MRYLVKLIPDLESGGFTALAPSLPGCISEGTSREEALSNMREALAGYLQVLKEDGDPIPPPDDLVEFVDIEVA